MPVSHACIHTLYAQIWPLERYSIATGIRVALNIMGHMISYKDYVCHGCGSNQEARAETGVGGPGEKPPVSVAEVMAMLHK